MNARLDDTDECPPDNPDVHGDRVDVRVVGVDDPVLSAAVRSIIHAAFREPEMRGRWAVVLAPSDTRGRWDLALTGARGRHMLSLSAVPKNLPDVLSMSLKRTLERLRATQVRVTEEVDRA